MEDIIVTLDSWEHPVDFMILSPKATLGGYPIIFGRPWLATTDAYIGCRLGDMTISDGRNTKMFLLCPPAQPTQDINNPIWPNVGEEAKDINLVAKIMMIDRIPFLQ